MSIPLPRLWRRGIRRATAMANGNSSQTLGPTAQAGRNKQKAARQRASPRSNDSFGARAPSFENLVATISSRISRRPRPARWGSTSRSGSAVCRKDGSSRSTALKARARRRSRCMSSPRSRRRAASAPFVDAEHCARSAICAQAGREPRRASDLAARHGEQALEIRRQACAFRRGQSRGGRFSGRGADAEIRTRG